MSSELETRHARTTEYLACMSALGAELNRAMGAVSLNALTELEDSVANQQVLTARLHDLAEDLSADLDGTVVVTGASSDDMASQIHAATQVLQHLNQCYAALLRHSSRCTAQLASVFAPSQEEEGTGGRPTSLSCQA